MSNPIVAIVSPGNMGSAIAARLRRSDLTVVTPTGRSHASTERARAVGIEIVDEAQIGEADYVFSIVPPSEAIAVAERLAQHVGTGSNRPLYIDWNAVSPARAADIAGIIAKAGGRFADGGIIGLPPGLEGPGPLLFASGPEAHALERLQDRGVRFKVLDAPVGAASALKMSYAGITKGTIALGAAMLLAAHRAGCADLLVSELASSQSQVFAAYQRSIPDMFNKAERWVPEIREIAAFIGSDRTESGIYDAMAEFYADVAADMKAERSVASILAEMLSPR